jgi:lysophospholipase L1-like esterase
MFVFRSKTERGIAVRMNFLARPHRVAGVLAGLAILCGAAFVGGLMPSPAGATSPSTLLALGDSLAAGYQPFDGQQFPPIDPLTGYRDQGYPGSYPADVASARGLALVDLACPGETTSSMLGTPAQPACETIYREEFSATSQLAAALTYLNEHPGRVGLVTLDIGANDLDRCKSTASVDYRCFAQSDTHLEEGLATIVGQLEVTLKHDDPGARIATMNYYDPFLALADRPGGVQGLKDASASLAAVNLVNAQLAISARLLDVALADVAHAFEINAVIPFVSYAGRTLPKDVVVTCQLTWMCPTKGGDGERDIHPNLRGYQAIASAFERVLP